MSRQITTSGASDRTMLAALIRFARSIAGDGGWAVSWGRWLVGPTPVTPLG